MAEPLGILAGGGVLPSRLIAACCASGRPVFVIAFEGHTDPQAISNAPHLWVRLGAAQTAIDALHEAGVSELVLAGPVRRPSLAELRPDTRAAGLVARGLLARGDDGLLRSIVQELEQSEGFRVIGVHDVLQPLVAAEGLLGAQQPDDQAHEDIARGCAVARSLGPLDVGQAVVVQQGIVLGVEAAEGTDALIERCATLRREGPGGVLVKLAKPGQEMRADMPTVGPHTVARSAAAGLRGIALHAGASLILDRGEMIAAADAAGLFVLGLRPDADANGDSRAA